MNLFAKEKQTHRLRKRTYGCQEERQRGRDSQGVWDERVHNAIFKVDNQQGPTVQHMELCSVLCGSPDGRGVQGRMDTCTCIAESLCCPPKTIITLLISYTPTQNKKVFKNQQADIYPSSKNTKISSKGQILLLAWSRSSFST